jgi:hypothetical protein
MIELGTVVRRRTCVRRNRWRVIFETCMNVAVELIAPPEIGVDERAIASREHAGHCSRSSQRMGDRILLHGLSNSKLGLRWIEHAVELLSRKEPGPSAASASPSGSGRSRRLLACGRVLPTSTPLRAPASTILNRTSRTSANAAAASSATPPTAAEAQSWPAARGRSWTETPGTTTRRHGDTQTCHRALWGMGTRGADQRRTPNALIGRPSAPCGAGAPPLRPVAGARAGGRWGLCHKGTTPTDGMQTTHITHNLKASSWYA